MEETMKLRVSIEHETHGIQYIEAEDGTIECQDLDETQLWVVAYPSRGCIRFLENKFPECQIKERKGVWYILSPAAARDFKMMTSNFTEMFVISYFLKDADDDFPRDMCFLLVQPKTSTQFSNYTLERNLFKQLPAQSLWDNGRTDLNLETRPQTESQGFCAVFKDRNPLIDIESLNFVNVYHVKLQQKDVLQKLRLWGVFSHTIRERYANVLESVVYDLGERHSCFQRVMLLTLKDLLKGESELLQQLSPLDYEVLMQMNGTSANIELSHVKELKIKQLVYERFAPTHFINAPAHDLHTPPLPRVL